MHVVLVEFVLHPGAAAAFHRRVLRQAADSLREPGCQRFDVCLDPVAPDRVVLYEIYRSAADFEAHLRTEHFRAFDAATAAAVAAKSVLALVLLDPAIGAP